MGSRIIRKKKPGTTAPPSPETSPVDSAATSPARKVGRPIGKIPTTLKIAYGRGKDWSKVTVDAPFHEKYGAAFDVDPAMLMAMEAIESGGEMIPNASGSGAFGIMQIKEDYWGWLAKQLDVKLSTREGQIAVAAAILGEYGNGKTPRERFLASYYPVYKDGQLCLSCKGEDGATPQQYLDDMDALIKIINAAAQGTTPADPPKRQVTEQDVLNLISSNTKGVYISFPFLGYNTNAAGQPVNIYAYGKGHGTTANNQHPGDDIWMPDETPVNAVFGGEVICVGGTGESVWGQGCGYFNDDDGGIGKISVLTDRSVLIKGKQRRMMMVYGHMSASYVRPGQMIEDGERIGRSGRGGSWPHVHLDVGVAEDFEGELNNPRIWNNPGRYHLLNPIPTIIAAYGGDAPNLPVPRVRYDFENDPNMFSVKVIKDVKVYQRADPGSEVLYTIKAGDTFEAVAIVPGNDGKQWWLGRIEGGRVPMEGTEYAGTT